MLDASRRRILDLLDERALVLDVGGGFKPFERADWVLDLLPYDRRGVYGYESPAEERFSRQTWVTRDMCAREPWPFQDDHFDFAVCSHTLEDVRDPVWVCDELVRVAKAGYIEVPSRLEEQSYGFQGPWVGWGHHHWLIDIHQDGIDFVFKHHVVHGRRSDHFDLDFHRRLSAAERVQSLWWNGSFSYRERVLTDAGSVDRYLADFVDAHRPPRGSPARRALGRVSRLLRPARTAPRES